MTIRTRPHSPPGDEQYECRGLITNVRLDVLFAIESNGIISSILEFKFLSLWFSFWI